MRKVTLTDEQLAKADLIAAEEHLKIARVHRQLASEALIRARKRQGFKVDDDFDPFDFDGVERGEAQ